MTAPGNNPTDASPSFWDRLGLDLLPFAQVASPDLPLSR